MENQVKADSSESSPTRQERLSALMRSTGRQILHHNGKRPGQGRILRMLKQEGSLTQQEIQNRLDIQSGSVSEILTKMESFGFITRERSAADRRKIVISITEAGIRELKEHEERVHRRQDALYGKLTPEEQDELIRLLTKLQDIWNSSPPAPLTPSDTNEGGTSK